MVFSIFNKFLNLEKIIDAKVENKIADTVKNQLAENITLNTGNSKQFVLITQNIKNIVGYDLQEDAAIGLQNGNKHQQLFAQDLQKLLNNNNISLENIKEKTQAPEFILAMTDAAKASYIESNEEKRQTLANLVYKKITVNDDFESLVLSQAIKVIGTLSEEQLKCLALIFLLHSKYIINNIKVDDLNDFSGKYITPLIDIHEESWELIGMGMYSSGCATTFTWALVASNFFPKIDNNNNENYPADDLLRSKIDNYETLRKLFQIRAFGHACLTPVGKYIAHSYLYTKTGLIIDWKK